MRRFIYLDTDTLNSYIAQISDGLISSQETGVESLSSKSEQNTTSPSVAADADLKIFGKGIGTKASFDFSHFNDSSSSELIKEVQTKQLHDNAFDQLVIYLERNKLLTSDDIGSFIIVEDVFYIMDLDYYQKLFNNKTIISYMRKGQEESLTASINEKRNILLSADNADTKKIDADIKKELNAISHTVKEESNSIKEMMDMLVSIIPYKRTLCISNNMVVLDEKYMRDKLDMTPFKYGGKIKVLGYITNKIGNSDINKELPDIGQISVAMNEVMLSFFTKQPSLNIVHPIAIYYE